MRSNQGNRGITSSGLVAVGLPVFNGEQHLPNALDSLLVQSHSNLEIHISDNASTDDTRDICLAYQVKDARIRYSRNSLNEGALANFRKVLRSAKAPYFMWASHDDWWERDFISYLLEILQMDKSLGLVASEAQYCLEDGTDLPFFPEGKFWREAGLNLTTSEARIRAAVRHGYGNLIYGLYRTPTLVDPLGNTVLDVFKDGEAFNEIPIFMQVAESWHINVIDRILMHKRTNLATYRQAATEFNAVLNPRPVNSFPEGQPRKFAQVSTHSGTRIAVKKGVLHMARVSRYHWDVFRQIVRASENLNLSMGFKTKLRLEAGSRLMIHVLRLFWRRFQGAIIH